MSGPNRFTPADQAIVSQLYASHTAPQIAPLLTTRHSAGAVKNYIARLIEKGVLQRRPPLAVAVRPNGSATAGTERHPDDIRGFKAGHAHTWGLLTVGTMLEGAGYDAS